MDGNILCARGLKKSFDGKLVLDGLDWDVKSGSVVLLRGENGCGKTTLLKIISRQLYFDDGEILFNSSNRMNSNGNQSGDMFFLGDGLGLYPDYSVKDWFDFNQYMGFSGEKLIENASYFQLTPYMKYRIGELSNGMKKRLFLCTALASDAKLILLDEPFNGIDYGFRKKIIELITLLKEKTFIIASHDDSLLHANFHYRFYLKNGRLCQDDVIWDKYVSEIDVLVSQGDSGIIGKLNMLKGLEIIGVENIGNKYILKIGCFDYEEKRHIVSSLIVKEGIDLFEIKKKDFYEK